VFLKLIQNYGKTVILIILYLLQCKFHFKIEYLLNTLWRKE